MRLRDLGRNSWFLVRHIIRQKIRGPLVSRAWERRQRPFIHEGARKIRFRLHPGQYIDNRIFFDGIYERRFLEFLSERLRSGGAMLDVGANIGNHALYLSAKFDEVHCFEPNLATLARLHDNLSLNHAVNIRVHPVGLGSKPGMLPFREVSENLGVSRFVAAGDQASTCLPVITGDQAVEDQDIENVKYIKIDVEGFEGEVLKGLRRTILRFEPIISFEFCGGSPGQASADAILSALPGYRLYEPWLEPRSAGRIQKIAFYLLSATNPRIVRITDLEPRYYPYILALPPHRLSEFEVDQAALSPRAGKG